MIAYTAGFVNPCALRKYFSAMAPKKTLAHTYEQGNEARLFTSHKIRQNGLHKHLAASGRLPMNLIASSCDETFLWTSGAFSKPRRQAGGKYLMQMRALSAEGKTESPADPKAAHLGAILISSISSLVHRITAWPPAAAAATAKRIWSCCRALHKKQA